MGNGNQTGGLLPGETEEPLSSPSPSAMASPGLQPGETEEPISTASTADPDPNGMKISPYTPSLWDRVKRVFQPDRTVYNPKYSDNREQLISPEEAMTPNEQQRHPFVTGAAEVAGGLTTPGNIALAGATGGLDTIPGVAGKVLPKLVSGYFSAQMAYGAYQKVPEFKAAVDRGDTSEAERIATHIVAGVGLAGLAARHATKGGPVEAPEAPEAPEPAALPPAPEQKLLTQGSIDGQPIRTIIPPGKAPIPMGEPEPGVERGPFRRGDENVPEQPNHTAQIPTKPPLVSLPDRGAQEAAPLAPRSVFQPAVESDEPLTDAERQQLIAAATRRQQLGPMASVLPERMLGAGRDFRTTVDESEGTQPRTTQGFALHPDDIEEPIDGSASGSAPAGSQGEALRGAWLGPETQEPQETGEAVPETEQPKSDMSEVDRSELPGKLVDPRSVSIDYESHPFRLQDDVDGAKERAAEGKPLTALVHTNEETGVPEVIDGHGSTEAALEMGLPLQITETPNVEGEEAIGLRAASHYLAADKPEVTAEVGDDVQNAGGIQPAGAEKNVPQLKAEDAAVRARLPESLVPAPSLREGLQEGEREEPIQQQPAAAPKDVTYWRTDTRTGRETKLDGPPAEGTKLRTNEIVSMRDKDGKVQVIGKGGNPSETPAAKASLDQVETLRKQLLQTKDAATQRKLGQQIRDLENKSVEEMNEKPKDGGGTTLHSNPFADPTLAIKAIKSVANFFTPDEDKASALESLRARTGEAAYQKEQIYQELKSRRDSWDSGRRASSDSPDAFNAFYDAIERGDKNRGGALSPEMQQSIARGNSQLTPADRQGMAVLRGLFDDTREAIRNLGTGKLQQFYDDYAPHRYAKDDGQDFSMSARRPLAGSKSALQQRTYATMAEGLDSGKSPESYNPYDMAMNHLQDMNKYLLSEGLKKSGREDGLVRFAKSKNSAPDGWVAVDPWRVGPGGVAGNWYAPKGYADVINRYLSPGLKGNPTYDFARGFNNVLTQLQLGVSAYHVGASGINSMVSGVALGMEQLARGATRFDPADIARGAKNIFTSPLKPILNFRQGGAEITKYLGKNLADEYTEAIKQAGGRVTLDPTYRNNAIESALKSWREGAKGQAILKTPAALLEAMSKPIMTTAMRMKLGAFHDLASDVFNQRDSQGWSDSKTTRELQSAWKSVDNRFGQVVYDNLNWNRTIKDLAQIGLRSTGWNWGTFSEIGGGLTDPVREAGKAIRGEDAKLLSHRTAYTMALPMVVGTLGGIYHYLHTGQAPQTAKDLFYPMNGQKTSTGEPDRSVFASYMKDVVGFSNHPFDTVINKLSPSISMMADMIENKDFYGDKIRNEDDPGMKQLADEVKYAVKEAIPFSVRNFQQSTKQSAEQAVENAVGVSPAPRAITRTDAENLAYKYNQDERPGSRTTEQTEKSRNISGWRQKYLSGQISTKDLRAAVSSKQLTLHDALQISNEKGKPSIVNLSNSLDLGRVLNIFDAANPAERKELRPLIAKKFGSLRLADHPPEERQQLIDRTRKALGVRGGRPASAPAPLAGSLPGSLDPYANLPSQLQ